MWSPTRYIEITSYMIIYLNSENVLISIEQDPYMPPPLILGGLLATSIRTNM